MTALLAASLSALMIFTALLSGVFGMAGGLILIGVLLVVMDDLGHDETQELLGEHRVEAGLDGQRP